MTAYIHPTALVNPGFTPAPFTIIDEGVAIFADVTIGSFVHVHAGAKLHEGCVIGDHVTIGAGVELHDGVVVSDFAFVGKEPDRWSDGEDDSALPTGASIGAGSVDRQPRGHRARRRPRAGLRRRRQLRDRRGVRSRRRRADRAGRDAGAWGQHRRRRHRRRGCLRGARRADRGGRDRRAEQRVTAPSYGVTAVTSRSRPVCGRAPGGPAAPGLLRTWLPRDARGVLAACGTR